MDFINPLQAESGLTACGHLAPQFRETYSQVSVLICQLYHIRLKSFAFLHELPCFSVIEGDAVWLQQGTILFSRIQDWSRFACIYVILQTLKRTSTSNLLKQN